MSQLIDPRLEELHRLVSSPEAPRRLHGFLRLEERLAELPEEGIGRLLDLASADPDPQIVSVGRRLRLDFATLRQERLHPAGGRSVFEVDAPLRAGEAAELGEVPPRAFRAAAESLLGESLTLVEALLARPPPAVLPGLLEAAGAVRHPRLVAALTPLASDPEAAGPVARALSGSSSEAARELLRRMARATGPGRARALEALAEAQDPQAEGLLKDASLDPDPEVRRAAARGLGSLPGPESRDRLRTLLEDPNAEVRLAAVPSWSRRSDPEVLEVLLEILRFRDEDDRLRAQVVTELRDHRSEEARDQLERMLQDPHDRVRANAVEALGGYEMTMERALRLFRPLTVLGAARVRGNAVLSLALTHPPAATEALLEMFDCYEAPVRQAAAYCAGMIQSERATERLALMMRTEQSQAVLSTGIRALSRIRGPRAIEILREFALKKSFGAICVSAVDLLADLGQASAVPTLVRLARESEEPDVRAASARAIARLAAHQGLSYLPRLLADPAPQVVVTAIEGLEESGHLEAIGLLSPLLHSRLPTIRGAAVTALWHLGEFSAVRTLEKLLASKDEEQLRAGLAALGRIGESLRVANLGRRSVLRLALLEAFRRTEPDEAAAVLAPARGSGGSAGPSGPGPSGSAPVPHETSAPVPPPAPLEAGELEALRLLEATYDQAGTPPQQALELLSRHPRSGPLLLVALRLVLSSRDPDLIANLERMATRQEELYLTPLALLAREARRRGDVKAFLELQLEMAHQQHDLLAELLAEADTCLEQDDLEGAAGAARMASSMLHSPPRLHALLGDHESSRGRPGKARAQFLKAFLAFPDQAVLAWKLATAARREGQPELARQAAKAAYRRDPDGPLGAAARALLVELGEVDDPPARESS